jgi:hypothetical protein
MGLQPEMQQGGLSSLRPKNLVLYNKGNLRTLTKIEVTWPSTSIDDCCRESRTRTREEKTCHGDLEYNNNECAVPRYRCCSLVRERTLMAPPRRRRLERRQDSGKREPRRGWKEFIEGKEVLPLGISMLIQLTP